MRFDRVWSMPNKNTFSIKPIRELIDEELYDIPGVSIDPFSGGNWIADFTNDLDPDVDAEDHMDAIDYLKHHGSNSVGAVLFDPPYSPRQVSECYRRLEKTVNMQTTQSSYWGNLKKEIARIVKPGGKVISCAWNSGGVGKTLGFELVRVLLVPHGGWHNDTIVTVEIKK